MTTLVGIVAKKLTPGVVLASDLTGTREEWTPQGDVAYRKLTKGTAQKIHVSRSRNFAVCMTGVADAHYNQFLYDLIEEHIDVRPSLEKGHFEELFQLNLRRFGGRTWDSKNQNSLLIASRYDEKPLLYTCWPLGRVEERNVTSIGSGSDHALEHLMNQKYLSVNQIGLEEAATLADRSLECAAADIYTGGFDMVVITPSGIVEYGKTIENHMAAAKKEVMQTIGREVSRMPGLNDFSI